MNTSRLNYGAQSRTEVRERAKWIRVEDFNGLRDFMSSGRKRTFAIVSPPIPVGSGCKAIRRVLMFDNHPDSLRLLPEYFRNWAVDLAAPPDRRRVRHGVVGFISIMTLGLGVFWPLLAS
jgi:hypothetical protein